MSHRIGRVLASIARVGFRLSALALLVAGVPAVLLTIGTLPHHVPSLSEAKDALLAPDDGSLLYTVLTVAAWIAWLTLFVPLLVEAAAVLARRSTPRLPGMAAGQRLAAYLLGGLLLASPAAAASAATPAVAVTASLPHAVSDADPAVAATASTPTEAADTVPAVSATQSHHVAEDGVLAFDVAEQRLGDGLRWKDLAHLNPELHITSAAFEIPAGSVLKLPADARPVQATTHTNTAAPAAAATTVGDTKADDADTEREYIVQPNDNLTGIAREETGDAANWHQLFEMNKGEQQPYGHRFTDPNLIYPGQHLTLPADTADQPQSNAPASPPNQHADHGAGAGDRDGATAATPNDDAAGSSASGGPETAAPTPSAATPTPSASQSPAAESAVPHTPTTSPSTTPSASDSPAPTASSAAPAASQSQGQQAGVFGLLATGVLAAGFLSFLGYRRITQLRRRRRGHHIPLPQGDAARVEHALRVTEAVIDTAVLEPILRTMAVQLADGGRELPAVAAIVLGERDIVLHLAEAAAPVPPFTAAPDQLTRWSCPTNTSELLPAQETGDIEDPYPALISLGWDSDGRLVLIDLEYVGHLHLSGPASASVLRTLALELATSEFTHHLDLALVGGTLAPGLAEELGERVSEHARMSEAAATLLAHHGDQQRALSLLGAPTLRHARTGVDTAAAWTPALVVACAPETGDTDGLEDLLQVVAAQPRTATAVLTTGPLPPDAPTTSWTLYAAPEAGPVRLPVDGVDIDCTLQALSDEHYAYALETLALSRADDIPAAQPELPVVHAPAVETNEAADEDAEPSVAALAAPDAAASAGPEGVPNLLAQFAALDEDGEPDSGGADDRAGDGVGEDGHDQDDDRSAVHSSTPPSTEADHAAVPGIVALGKPGRALAASAGPVPAQQAPARAVSIRLPNDVLAESVPLDTVSVAPATETGEPEPPHPVVRVLGPVDVAGTRGTLTEKKRQRTYTELAVWLVLHPGHHPNALDHRALDEALWPDKDEVSLKYRNAVVSRTRTWLGRDTDGQPYIPLLKTANSRYSISPAVGCDWHDFQRLTQAGKDPRTPHPDLVLRQALELVRGRPFGSVDRRRYKWAEHLALVMTMEIVDAAEILAEHRLTAHDPRGALWAATKGLEVAPAVESLHRILFQAYAAIGDYAALERAASWLEEFTEGNDLELDDETLAVLDQLRARI